MAAVERFDVIVVGGGQAGLAAGYPLARLGRHFVILDERYRAGEDAKYVVDKIAANTRRT